MQHGLRTRAWPRPTSPRQQVPAIGAAVPLPPRLRAGCPPAPPVPTKRGFPPGHTMLQLQRSLRPFSPHGHATERALTLVAVVQHGGGLRLVDLRENGEHVCTHRAQARRSAPTDSGPQRRRHPSRSPLTLAGTAGSPKRGAARPRCRTHTAAPHSADARPAMHVHTFLLLRK